MRDATYRGKLRERAREDVKSIRDDLSSLASFAKGNRLIPGSHMEDHIVIFWFLIFRWLITALYNHFAIYFLHEESFAEIFQFN